MADLIRDSKYVDPELAEILRAGPTPKGLDASTDIHALRKLLSDRKKEMTSAHSTSPESAIEETDHQIPTRDGANITVRVYRNKDQNDDGPLMVILHGGGWVLGDLNNEALLCRQWCEAHNGVAVNVEYRLAPEHVFPTAVYDSYDSLLWAAAQAKSIGADCSKGLIIAGVSAGASMAATIAHLYRDEGCTPPLTGVYLSIPSVLAPQAVPEKYKSRYRSRDENANALILNREAIKLFRKLYQDDPLSPLMSPFIFPTGHGNLPPTYFQICGLDPLRDEALFYEEVLREESNIATKVDLYPGLPHGFWSWWPEAQFSKKHFKDSIEGLTWLLQKH